MCPLVRRDPAIAMRNDDQEHVRIGYFAQARRERWMLPARHEVLHHPGQTLGGDGRVARRGAIRLQVFGG